MNRDFQLHSKKVEMKHLYTAMSCCNLSRHCFIFPLSSVHYTKLKGGKIPAIDNVVVLSLHRTF